MRFANVAKLGAFVLWFMAMAILTAQSRKTEQGRDLQIPKANTEQKDDSGTMRQALVIGNADYQNAPKLKNPVNDANDIADVLKSLGFHVTLLSDANREKMQEAIVKFGKDLTKSSGVGLFYYAGHGVEVQGKNYLVPIEAKLEAEHRAEFECVNAQEILVEMEAAKNPTNLIFLDACRNNPFARNWRSVSKGNGLTAIEAPSGSLVAYATAPGKVAKDGNDRNGIFTKYLLKHIKTPGLEVRKLLELVRKEVKRTTYSTQIPWESCCLEDSFYFLKPQGPKRLPSEIELELMEKWNNRLQEMERAFQRIDRGSWEPEAQIRAWQEFLRNFAENNPYTEADNNMREEGQKQLLQLREGIAEYRIKERLAKAEREAKRKSEQAAREKALREAAEREEKAIAEMEAKQQAEQMAQEKIKREAKLKAAQEAKVKADLEEKARVDQEAKVKAEASPKPNEAVAKTPTGSAVEEGWQGDDAEEAEAKVKNKAAQAQTDTQPAANAATEVPTQNEETSGPTIASGETKKCEITVAGQQDFYAFNANKDETVTLLMVRLEGDLTCNLSLQDPEAAIETTGTTETIDGRFCSFHRAWILAHKLAKSGTYYVICDDKQGTAKGKYGLALFKNPCQPPSRAGYEEIRNKGTKSKKLFPENLGVFTFLGQKDQPVTILADSHDGNVHVDLDLHAPNGTIEKSADRAQQALIKKHTLEQTGYYFIVSRLVLANHRYGGKGCDYSVTLFKNFVDYRTAGLPEIKHGMTKKGQLAGMEWGGFSFDGKQGEVVTISMGREGGDWAPMFELYAPSNNIEKLVNEDGANGDLAKLHMHMLAQTGRYYIVCKNARRTFASMLQGGAYALSFYKFRSKTVPRDPK